MGLPLCVPSMIRLLTMSARGRPRRPESWFRFRSGDMKSSGCRSGVRQNGEEPDSRSESTVRSGAILRPGVSGVSAACSAQNAEGEACSCSDCGVVAVVTVAA